MLELRFSPKSSPFRRTPRPKSWMICEPSFWPTFISPMVETRQLLHPSANFLAPTSRLTFEVRELSSSKSEPPNSRCETIRPSSSRKRRASPPGSPTLITPKGSQSPTLSASSPGTPFISSIRSVREARLPLAPAALKNRDRIES